MVLQKTLESSLDYEESDQSILKEINPEKNHGINSGRTDAQAESPILWPPDANS